MSSGARRQVLWLNLEGATWHRLHPLLDSGLLPHLGELVARGAMGTLQAAPPLDGTLLWNSLVTGQTAAAHGIAAGVTETGEGIVDADRRCPAIWEMAAHEGLKSTVIGGWSTHACATGNATLVSEYFGSPKLAKTGDVLDTAVYPERYRGSLAECWLRPEEIDVETLEWFVPAWREIDQDRDPRLALIGDALAHTLSRHACYAWLLEHESPELAMVNYSLIDQLGVLFQVLDQPLSDRIPSRQVELFGQVMERCYQLADMLLGRVLELAQPDAHIVVTSTHGFRPLSDGESLRSWFSGGKESRLQGGGVFVAAGPAFRADSLVHGGTIYDVVPTLLSLLELPVAQDMRGRRLAEAFVSPPTVNVIPTWSGIRAEAPPGERVVLPQAEKAQLAHHFRELGVIGVNGKAEPRETSADEHPAAIRWRWNLARACVQSGHLQTALPHLEQLAEQYPENHRYLVALIQCQIKLGLLLEAQELIAELQEYSPDSPIGYICLARVEQAAGRYEDSLQAVENARERGADSALLNVYSGLAYLRLSRWTDALENYESVLERQPDSADAWRGKTRALLGLKQFGPTCDAALEAIRLDYRQPLPHFMMGVALLKRGMDTEALVSFQTCVKLSPDWPRPHMQLLRIKRRLGYPQGELDGHREAIRLGKARVTDAQQLSRDAIQRQQERMQQRSRQREQAVSDLLAQPSGDSAAMPLNAMNHTIVSSLPRGGGATAMAMLEAGGATLLKDEGQRFEWSRAQELPRDPHVLDAARGKILYLPSALLAFLPRIHHYRVIFVDRPLGELVVSQRQLTGAGDTEGGGLDAYEQARLQLKHRDGCLNMLRTAPNIDLLRVEFRSLIEEPVLEVTRIREFVGDDLLSDANAMVEAISPALHHVKLMDAIVPQELKTGIFSPVF